MTAKFALKTAYYIAMVGVLGDDKRARGGPNVDDFITALVTIGFACVPNTGTTELALRWVHGPYNRREQLLPVRRPAASDGWWGYEYAATAESLQEIFHIERTDFIELPEDAAVEGVGFSIAEWD
ncbi:hypothetical protein ONZ51_g9580 [Trametes cubensis]|uniref:Uncharacterized protein n=1 Tax=Trametes cubensis TaxID=1111947 RepID=A0AAD7X863_9APHY|nr:hypothetical protein ONZ51_g9580 [Trametes cubensis]